MGEPRRWPAGIGQARLLRAPGVPALPDLKVAAASSEFARAAGTGLRMAAQQPTLPGW